MGVHEVKRTRSEYLSLRLAPYPRHGSGDQGSEGAGLKPALLPSEAGGLGPIARSQFLNCRGQMVSDRSLG